MKLKIWEVALMIAVVVSLLTVTVVAANQQQLSNKLIRLHVVANSDSEEDQTMKLYVRDAVLEKAQELIDGAENSSQAEEILTDNLNQIAAVASEKAQEYGYSAVTTLEDEYFPTRQYDTFALPAGTYKALRITIGEGKGHNWWCVVFPPLCVSAASEEQFVAAGLTESEESLITEKSTGYVIKFKVTELFGKLKNAIQENF